MLQQRALAMFLGLLLIVVLPGALWAQDTARLQGSVVDPSRAAVPNAKVTIINTATGQESGETSDSTNGTFAVPGLKVGQYIINVEAPGFQKYVQDVRLDPGQVANASITLMAGEVTQTVIVSDQAALVDSATSSVGAVINSAQVTDLPLNGRNFTQLATLSPGVSRGVPTSAATGSGGNAESSATAAWVERRWLLTDCVPRRTTSCWMARIITSRW